MKDLWNEICYDMSECKRRNVLEKEYENTLVQCLAILGWKKYLGEITTQYPIQVGHETKLADIVVSSNGTEQFVIEVKKPGHVICPEDERQMFSYMRLLKHQVLFGLYIGDDIRLYYDDKSSQSFPEPLFIVDITKDNPDGVQFVELFVKESFDIEKLQEFCRLKKEEMKLEQRIEEETARLLADRNGNILKQLYREHCINLGLEEDFAERVLKELSISILPQNTPTHDAPVLYGSENRMERKERNDKGIRRGAYQPKTTNRYSFEGSAPMGCGRLALAIVKRFVKDNPHLSINDIRNALPDWAKIRTIQEIQHEKIIKNDDLYERRWFTDSQDMIDSADGKTFALTTQWSANGNYPSNIRQMIVFARSKGYVVEEL